MDRNHKTPSLEEVIRHPGWTQNIVGGLMVAIFFILLYAADAWLTTDPTSIKQNVEDTNE